MRSADTNGGRRVLDWGLSVGLVQVGGGGLLGVESLAMQGVGDTMQGRMELPAYIDRPQAWPSILGADGATVRGPCVGAAAAPQAALLLLLHMRTDHRRAAQRTD